MADLVEWLANNGIEQVETIVPDMAGRARGKLVPATLVGKGIIKLPEALFGQTAGGDYYLPDENVEDRDMHCRPAAGTARIQPWASEPTASVLLDCFDADGSTITIAPRAVLQRVVDLYADRGWRPVVAPEVEFYLLGDEPVGDAAVDPYGTDQVHDHAALFERLNDHCQRQGISLGAMSQELGPGQFEINFQHGDAVRLADDPGAGQAQAHRRIRLVDVL
ncbi:MAG: glutamine synthetase, partial [Gammaproteobacteria bacterium]